jgi:NAD-dependent dihydropyrimidine dehydrogenase PreA subunit
MPYVITEACINIKDRACVDVCPVDCIYEGPDQREPRCGSDLSRCDIELPQDLEAGGEHEHPDCCIREGWVCGVTGQAPEETVEHDFYISGKSL